MPLTFHSLLSFLFCACCVIATNIQVHDDSFQPDETLHITSINAEIACTTRQSVVINGTTPGPAVTLNAEKTTWIRVYNDMTDQNATIHWHGLTESVAPFSDGTPLASQWPIPPGHFFDYELHPTDDEAGSYFYHSVSPSLIRSSQLVTSFYFLTRINSMLSSRRCLPSDR